MAESHSILHSLNFSPIEDEPHQEDGKQEYATEVKLFGKWSYEGIVC